MMRSDAHRRSDGPRGYLLGRPRTASDGGFTLVEMTTSVAVMLVVMTAAWLLLTSSNANLNRVGNGSQASELNRAAFASFERDLGHAVLPSGSNISPVLVAGPRTCSFLADVDTPADERPELVTWMADDTTAAPQLLRVVTRAPSSVATDQITSLASFSGGISTTSSVLTGLSTAADLGSAADLGQTTMFSYAVSATNPGTGLAENPGLIGLIELRLRNGLPDKNTNVVDRVGAFRVIAYVINGY